MSIETFAYLGMAIILLSAFYKGFIQTKRYNQPPGDDQDDHYHYHDADIDLINQGKPFYYE